MTSKTPPTPPISRSHGLLSPPLATSRRSRLLSRWLAPALVACLAPQLSGCAWIRGALREGAGADAIVAEDSNFWTKPSPVNLAALISGKKGECDVQKALKDFYTTYADHPERAALERNRIQDYLLALSNRRMADYERYLQSADAGVNTLFGTATTVLAGLGAIVTPVDTARAFTAAAAITSGTRAEINANYFANKTIQVLADAMKAGREEIHREILTRRTEGIGTYTLEAALADVERYHGEASLIAGLRRAAISVDRAQRPGLDELSRALKSSQEFTSMLQGSGGSLVDDGDALRSILDALEAIRAVREAAKQSGERVAKLAPSYSSFVDASKAVVDASQANAVVTAARLGDDAAVAPADWLKARADALAPATLAISLSDDPAKPQTLTLAAAAEKAKAIVDADAPTYSTIAGDLAAAKKDLKSDDPSVVEDAKVRLLRARADAGAKTVAIKKETHEPAFAAKVAEAKANVVAAVGAALERIAALVQAAATFENPKKEKARDGLIALWKELKALDAKALDRINAPKAKELLGWSPAK